MMINFNSLPYTCKLRFTEIAESEIIYKFSKLNSSTKALCKNRKVVKNLEYFPFAEGSKSDALPHKNNSNDFKKFKSVEIINEFKISFEGLTFNEEADLDISYRFDDFKMIPRIYRKLDLDGVVFENISDLTELIGSNLIEFSYLPRFCGFNFSENWQKEVNDLFAALDKVKTVRFLLGFIKDETDEEFAACDEIIEKWRKQRKTGKNLYWHISWIHGPNGTLAKVYRKTSLKTILPNGRSSFNKEVTNDACRFDNIVTTVHIEKIM